jgi:lysine 2,3-aminomutase
MNELRGHTTGYAIPQYVLDGPGGGGKIPLNPDYLLAHDGRSVILRNFKGDIYEYPEPDPEPVRPALALHDDVAGPWMD